MPSSCRNALRVAITTEIWLLMVPLQASKPPRGSKVSTAVLEWRKCNSACQAAGQPSALMRQVREVEWVTQQSGEASIATGPNRQSVCYFGYAHKSKMLNIKLLFGGGQLPGPSEKQNTNKKWNWKKKSKRKETGKNERKDRLKEGRKTKERENEEKNEREKEKERQEEGRKAKGRKDWKKEWLKGWKWRIEGRLEPGMEQRKTLKEMYEGWEGMKKKQEMMGVKRKKWTEGRKMNENLQRKEGRWMKSQKGRRETRQ